MKHLNQASRPAVAEVDRVLFSVCPFGGGTCYRVEILDGGLEVNEGRHTAWGSGSLTIYVPFLGALKG